MRAAFAQRVGHGLAGHVVAVDQQLNAARLVQRVEVVAVQVFNQLHDHGGGVVGVFHQHGHIAQPGNAGGRKTALTRNDLVRGMARGLVFKRVLQALGGQAAHQDGLQHAIELHGGGHGVQIVVFNDLPVGLAAGQRGDGQGVVDARGLAGLERVVGAGVQHSEGVHGQVHQCLAALQLVLAAARCFANDFALLAGLWVGFAALEGGGIVVDAGRAADEGVFGGHGLRLR